MAITMGDYIDAKIYDDTHDKLLYRQHELLKFLADYQSSSFSYIMFRKIAQKMGFIKTNLPKDIEKMLDDLLDVRNWTFHNPQSMMVAAKEAYEKNLPDWLIGKVKIVPQLNPIVITKISKYETVVLSSLVLHTESRIRIYNSILSRMKLDYQEMYESIKNKCYILTDNGISDSVQLLEDYRISGLSDYVSDLKQISMAIQKSEYEGSKEDFDKCVIRYSTDQDTKK